MFEILGCVASLNIAPARFFGFHFDDVGPKLLVSAKRVHDGGVTLRLLGMMRTSVVLFKDGMMNDGCRHFLYCRWFPLKFERGRKYSPVQRKIKLQSRSITHVRRGCVIELLGLRRIEPSQDRVLSLGSSLISQLDENQSKIIMRQYVIAL